MNWYKVTDDLGQWITVQADNAEQAIQVAIDIQKDLSTDGFHPTSAILCDRPTKERKPNAKNAT